MKRRIARFFWHVRKWWMLRQLPRPQAEIMREIDRARAQHRPVNHLHRQLQAHVHQDLRS